MSRIETDIKFCGQPVTIVCDGKCNQAWGISWGGLKAGNAPEDPGTYEGSDAKPLDSVHNRWCARECERSKLLDKLK